MREAIIIGAGAAGIACAQRFDREGIDFEILEARDRVGGRVFSVLESNSAPSVELGAEFIHGAASEILSRLANLQLPFVEAKDTHLMLQNKKLVPLKTFWELMGKMIGKLHAQSVKDRSISDFLKASKAPSRDKDLFAAFVEGFHAADLNVMGAKALADTEETDEVSLNGAELFRPLFRYDSMFLRLAEKFIVAGLLHLKTEVKRIEWSPGKVRLECVQGPARVLETYECKKLVVTVPIGVLKSQSIEWSPEPEGLYSMLEHIHMGHVQRIVFHFRERFWEKLSDHPVGFLHCSADNFFPTWWTFQPLRTPHIVAWQGGPKALELARLPEAKRVEIALKTLSKISGKSLSKLNADVESWHTHNWTDDPFARGAYSYVGVNGMGGSRKFSRPIEDTLYFAGEGAHGGSARGTVHGALDSGWKVADKF